MKLEPSSQSSEEEHIPYSKTKEFRWSLFGPLIAGVIVYIVILTADSLWWRFCFSAECFNNIAYLFKVPLAVAGLAIPLVAMTATIYRSKETSMQIRQSARQYAEAVTNNRFGNYLKHKEWFVKYLQERAVDFEVEGGKFILDAPALYSHMYPRNDFQWLDVNSDGEFEFWHTLRYRFERLVEMIEKGRDSSFKIDDAFIADFILMHNQLYLSLKCKLEGGVVISPAGHGSFISTYSVEFFPLGFSLFRSFKVVESIVEMLESLGVVELDIVSSGERLDVTDFAALAARMREKIIVRNRSGKELKNY
ncbi:hypothetical protein [Pseudomonas nitroreducens]|uniref:hypothetical protein n=1 Tax=Pseudomonas nitroreducens TaxID=46680 RepID=UPI00382A5B0F